MPSGIEGSLAAFRADFARCMRKIINESTTMTDDVKIGMFSILFGYEKPKPLITVSGRPMVIQAMQDLPKTDAQIFILREDLQDLETLKSELIQASNNAQFSILKSITDGQATTCVEGSKHLKMDSKVTIAACDNGMNYDSKLFDEMMEFVDDVIDLLGSRKQIEFLRSIAENGTSSDRQIKIYNENENINDVVDSLIKETLDGC